MSDHRRAQEGWFDERWGVPAYPGPRLMPVPELPQAAWPSPPQAAWRPAPEPEVLEAITGRACQVPGFWTFAGTLTVLMLLPALILVAWAALSTSADRSKGPQLAWGITLAVFVLGMVGLWARTGTTADHLGLKRIKLLEAVRVDWSQVVGFSEDARGRPGLTMATANRAMPSIMVPSAMHTMPTGEASMLAQRLNAVFECRPVTRWRSGASQDRDAIVTWSTWSWFWPLVTIGLAAPVVFFIGGLHTRRHWLYLAAACTFDLLVASLIMGEGPAPAQLASGVIGMATWFGSTAVIAFIWRRERRATTSGR